jgi:UDP-galactopyranose mutase
MGVTSVDYLIVGSGLTGSTIARRLADAGREVLILERRAHIGGNVHDTLHASGVRVHTYGPHYFRCSAPRIWQFVNRFSEFQPYAAHVKILADGVYENWPVRRQTVQRYPDWVPPQSKSRPRNFEEACLRKVPPQIYHALIEGYTRRQWGVEPRRLDAELARRIRLNDDDQHSLTPHCRYQALPVRGYADWMAAMIDGISCIRGVDYFQQQDQFRARKLLVITGSLDEYFGFDEGRLSYRGQRRKVVFHPGRDSFQPCVQVNHPGADESAALRTIEWKYLLPPEQRRQIAGTVVTHEFPFSPTVPDEFEYPFPDSRNEALCRRYLDRAARIPNLLICGRLGDYRYYDMDHAIGRALHLADRILHVAPATADQRLPVGLDVAHLRRVVGDKVVGARAAKAM